MGSSTREEVREDFDVLRAAVSRVVEHSYDALTTPERLALQERLEQETRRLGVPGQQLINQLGAQAGDEELGGTLRCALADRLRITKAEAGRRIEEAEDLGERRALSGEPLAPQLSATAAGQRRGLIGEGHIKVIRSFFGHLPAEVDVSTREADLAGKARTYCPDELAKYARRVMDWLHPDGEFNDVQGWQTTRRTHINDLALACGPDNRLAEQGWTTRTNARGDTEWIPPPHLDHGQPRTNPYHHPERFRHDDEGP